MKKAFFFLLIILFVSFSCKESNGGLKKEENGGDNVYSVDGDDEQMNSAIEKAVKSYDEFLRKFDNPDGNSSDFSVKMMFSYADGNEHMWLNDLFRKEYKLYGVLDSDPITVTSVKAGDTVAIAKEKISDWMYLRNDTLVGGYTIRALYNKMSEKEKIKFKNETGFVID